MAKRFEMKKWNLATLPAYIALGVVAVWTDMGLLQYVAMLALVMWIDYTSFNWALSRVNRSLDNVADAARQAQADVLSFVETLKNAVEERDKLRPDATRWEHLTTTMTTSQVNDAVSAAFRTSNFRAALAHQVDEHIRALEEKADALRPQEN